MSNQHDVLATLYPSTGQRQRAFACVLVMICGAVVTLPLVGEPAAHFEAFNLMVDTSLAIVSALVALLLFAQFSLVRATGVLFLACGFLLVSLTTVPQMLRAAQDVFIDMRLRFITDVALPVAAIAYLFARRDTRSAPDVAGAARLTAGAVAISILIAAFATWLAATRAVPEAAMPEEPAVQTLANLLQIGAAAAAVVLMWPQRASVLGLWLLVALTGSLVEALLQCIARDDTNIAWSMAHLYSLAGTTCLLLALLADNVNLGARLVGGIAERERGHRSGGDAARRARHAACEAALNVIANDLNQPLCAITANVDAAARLLERQPPDLAEVRAALSDIASDVMRAGASVRGAQRRVSGTHEPPDLIDVAKLLDECLHELRAEMLLHSVTCEVETTLPLPDVRGFRRQLLQLLTHLVTNSVEAMAGVQQRERRLRVHARPHDARAVAICVEDSGVGIEPEHATRIFEPFFTTKPYRSGLGLAICRHIVDAHGGHISVTAGGDGGAAFMVVLPAGS